MAPVKVGDTVKVNFTCKLEDGTVYETSIGKDPLQFVVGDTHLLPGFEKAVTGMNPGESKTMTLAIDDAYGPYNRKLRLTIHRNDFPGTILPEIGMQIQAHQSDGETKFVTITDVTDTTVSLDGNHPLAGKDLIFEIELLDIVRPGPSALEYFNLGTILQDNEKFDEAIMLYHKAIAVDPSLTDAFYNLAVAFQKKGLTDEAISYYQQAIKLNENNEKACLNLGIALREKGQYEEAIQYFQKALEIKPDYAMAHYNLGTISHFHGHIEEAQKYYDKVISLNPEYADAHWNIALINLLLGNFAEGWKGYEWRWKIEGLTIKKEYHRPRWDGSDIAGKTILICTEQGFGDTIQFIRYAPLVAERRANVVITCQKELQSLLTNMKGIERVITDDDELPEFDVYCPLMSLPFVFKTTLEDIPSRVPYIKIDSSLTHRWRERFDKNNALLKIGIAWSGGPELTKPYYNRSCPLDSFSSLTSLRNISLYSLQKGESALEIDNAPQNMQLVNFMDETKDFADTGALIENLDLVISVDTAVAHLAGALGKPVWTLLPFVPDWRWMLTRDDSPWYPTMRLFRQSSPGDWKSVIDRVKDSLHDFINTFKNQK